MPGSMSTCTEEWFSAPYLTTDGTVQYVPIDRDILQVPVFVTLDSCIEIKNLSDSQAESIHWSDVQSTRNLTELEIRLANEGVIILESGMTSYPKVIPSSILTGCVLSQHDSFCVISIYYYFLDNSNKRRKEKVSRFVYVNGTRESTRLLNNWYKCIQLLVRGTDLSTIDVGASDWQPEQVLVLVNPKSGKKEAEKIFGGIVTRMLNQACMDFRQVITGEAGQAQSYAYRERLDVFAAILLVSGDGLYNEFINGLMTRVDWKSAIKIPIGIIPAGSNNTLAGSILHQRGEHTERKYAVTNCMFAFIKGHTHPTDILKVKYNNLVDYSGLYHTWGNLAEIYHKSRNLAFLGKYRLTFWVTVRLIQNKNFHGKIFYRPAHAPSDSEFQELPTNGFTVFSVSNVSHISYHTALVPKLAPSSGYAVLCYVRHPMPRKRLLKILRGAQRGDGSHAHTHDFESVAVSAFVVIPDKGNESKTLLDGEKLPTSHVECEVLPSIAKLKY